MLRPLLSDNFCHYYMESSGRCGGLALRAAPSSNPDVPIQTYLSGNTAVQVLDGPIEADGYTWWQVHAANQEDWCAGEFLEVR